MTAYSAGMPTHISITWVDEQTAPSSACRTLGSAAAVSSSRKFGGIGSVETLGTALVVMMHLPRAHRFAWWPRQ